MKINFVMFHVSSEPWTLQNRKFPSPLPTDDVIFGKMCGELGIFPSPRAFIQEESYMYDDSNLVPLGASVH